ncbi:MAG: DUF3854 domain-containing protein [Victivallales bacterium]
MNILPEINKLASYLNDIGITDPIEQDLYVEILKSEAEDLGFHPATDGILICHLNLDGTSMIGEDERPFAELRHADGQLPEPGRRYNMRYKSGTHLFFSRRLKKLLEEKDYCIITEGAKKASVLSCLGFPCIGIIGWCSWRKTGTDELHADFNQIDVAGRTFYLLPDFDGAFNPDIHREIRKLSLALYKYGAEKIKLMKLPPVSGEKMGVDDFLMSLKESQNV